MRHPVVSKWSSRPGSGVSVGHGLMTAMKRDLFVHAGVAGLLAAATVVAVSTASSLAGGTSAGRSVLVPVVPCRLADTRSGADNVGTRSTPLQAAESHVFEVWGHNGNCDIPVTATGVSTNVTIANPTAASYLTVFPADAPRPLSSNLNWTAASSPTPNQVTVGVSAQGAIGVYNNAGTVDVIIDVVGYYEAEGSDTGTVAQVGSGGADGAPGPAGADGAPGPAGADGRTILSGTGAPVGGEEGDFFIDTATNTIYGPKTAVGWVVPGTPLTGPAGPKGPAGPTGIVTIAAFSALIAPIAANNVNYVFAGGTATVTTTAKNQRLTAVAEGPMGLAAGSPADDLRVGICYQAANSADKPMNFNSGNYSLQHFTTTRQSYSAVGTIVMTDPGTWNVGLCVLNDGAGPITNNDYSNGWVQVTN